MTTNLVNGKKYIGKDRYNNPEYLGSGKIFKQALEKYGKQSFKKDIIEVCESIDHLNQREKYWIQHYNANKNPVFYNIAEGGEGGNTRSGMTNKDKKEYYSRISQTKKTRKYTWHPSPELREHWSRIRKGKPNKNKGKTATEIFGSDYVPHNKGKSILSSHTASIIHAYTIAKQKVKDIAKNYNVFPGTVSRLLKSNGITIQHARGANIIGRRLKRKTDQFQDSIISDFKSGLKLKEICKKYNLTISIIEKLLRENKLRRYPRNQQKLLHPLSV